VSSSHPDKLWKQTRSKPFGFYWSKGFFDLGEDRKYLAVVKSTRGIPKYDLDQFRKVHRIDEDEPADFGCSGLSRDKFIRGFELYSSRALVRSIGPLRSAFYRISITVTGTLDMSIGLEKYSHQPRTLAFTFPNQIFSKNNISADAFGYYMLFEASFLEELLPPNKLQKEFPFLSPAGIPVFMLSQTELTACIDVVKRMNSEIRSDLPGRERAIQLNLYLLLLEAKRSYDRQKLNVTPLPQAGHGLVSRFYKLVGTHFSTQRKVSDYACMLSVSANHLNKVVKEVTGRTASDCIREMLVQEAKLLLLHTDKSVAEIGYQLEFSGPASFNRFFKAETGETPMTFRSRNN